MPRKKKSEIEAIETPQEATPVGDTITDSATETGKKSFIPFVPNDDKPKVKPRLSFGLTDDGVLDTSSTRAETLSRIKEFFNDPRNAKLLGRAQVEQLISEKDVEMLLDVVGTIEGYAFHVGAKIDLDIAQKHAAFTEEQKKLLVPSAQNVIAKYAGSLGWYLRWKDEIALAGILLVLTRAKLETARIEQAQRIEEKKTLDSSQNPAFVKHELPNMGLDAVSSEIMKN